MGNTKSFRMSDRIENMFNSIKKHYITEKSDTEVLFSAIEMMFDAGTVPHNSYYRETIEKYLKEKEMITFFRKICDLLEVLSFSDGLYLEDEMIHFLTSEVTDCFFEGYDDLEKINRYQYRQVWRTLEMNYGYCDIDLTKFGEKMQNYYANKE